jgi:hypothetical protein
VAAHADGPLPTQLAAAFEACREQPQLRDAWRRRFEPAAEGRPAQEPPGLDQVCPEVHGAIASAPFAQYLLDDWSQRPTPGRLEQLRKLLEGAGEPAAAHALDPAGVAPILDSIRVSRVQLEKSLWQRFRDWLAAILERRPTVGGGDWLADWWKEHMPTARATEIIAYGVMALLIAGAAWVVIVELRANGLLRRGARQARGGPATGATVPAGDAATTGGDDDQPALLIGLLLERLRAIGLVRDRPSMTHREIIAAARLDGPEDRATFAALVAVAERLRYASARPAREQLRRTLDAGRALLVRLAAVPRAAS